VDHHGCAARSDSSDLVRYYLRLGLLGFGGPVAPRGPDGARSCFAWKVSNPLLLAVAAVIGLVGFPAAPTGLGLREVGGPDELRRNHGNPGATSPPQLLKIGATAYGGPAIMGIMQTELQEKRQWVSKERFVEGLSLVNMLPGATAAQLSIFLGYARGGWWGGLLGGLCFVLPGFFLLLLLTIGYAAFGVTPVLRNALYGLGPVVLAIYLVAVYRLGRNVMTTLPSVLIGLAAAALSMASPLGVAAILLLAAASGSGSSIRGSSAAPPPRRSSRVSPSCTLSRDRRRSRPCSPTPVIRPRRASWAVGALLLQVGALTFGGGISMIAFIQEQVVRQLHWLTPQEFIDGLALGQLTPGPVLMVAAYVGYKAAGIAGAVVGAVAAFLPSFVMMLAILPAFDRARQLRWTRAALRGIAPAVIGVLAVSLVRLAPHAVPDLFAAATLVVTIVVLMLWRVATIKVMLLGVVVGIVRGRLLSLPGSRALFSTVTRA
jgi:chromate transporter